jgi:hypothetical protein
MAPSRFTSAVCLVAIVGCLIVVVGPLLLGAPAAFRGSVVASALFGAVFAGYSAYSMRTYGQPRLAAGFITAVFGLWFVGAPLVYTVPDVLTAVVQTGGSLTAAFGGYATVEALEILFRGTPLVENVPDPTTTDRPRRCGRSHIQSTCP